MRIDVHAHYYPDALYELLERVVITTGPEAYRRADGICVIPAALLGP